MREEQKIISQEQEFNSLFINAKRTGFFFFFRKNNDSEVLGNKVKGDVLTNLFIYMTVCIRF